LDDSGNEGPAIYQPQIVGAEDFFSLSLQKYADARGAMGLRWHTLVCRRPADQACGPRSCL